MKLQRVFVVSNITETAHQSTSRCKPPNVIFDKALFCDFTAVSLFPHSANTFFSLFSFLSCAQ